MLGFVEEIALLQLDDATGQFIDLPRSVADVVIAGAALMELAIKNRIDSDLERLFVVERMPTDDAILDDALTVLAAGETDLTIGAALERVARNARRYQQLALQRLVRRGILRERDGRFLWVFSTRRYPVVNDSEQREVKTRLRQLLLTDELPDPQDVVLICLLDACNLLRLVLTPSEIGAAAERIAQLGRLDLIGQAVTRAVSEIRFVVGHAAGPG